MGLTPSRWEVDGLSGWAANSKPSTVQLVCVPDTTYGRQIWVLNDNW